MQLGTFIAGHEENHKTLPLQSRTSNAVAQNSEIYPKVLPLKNANMFVLLEIHEMMMSHNIYANKDHYQGLVHLQNPHEYKI